jgi:PIN domain nuclease of toxin-antitoxin system
VKAVETTSNPACKIQGNYKKTDFYKVRLGDNACALIMGRWLN